MQNSLLFYWVHHLCGESEVVNSGKDSVSGSEVNGQRTLEFGQKESNWLAGWCVMMNSISFVLCSETKQKRLYFLEGRWILVTWHLRGWLSQTFFRPRSLWILSLLRLVERGNIITIHWHNELLRCTISKVYHRRSALLHPVLDMWHFWFSWLQGH